MWNPGLEIIFLQSLEDAVQLTSNVKVAVSVPRAIPLIVTCVLLCVNSAGLFLVFADVTVAVPRCGLCVVHCAGSQADLFRLWTPVLYPQPPSVLLFSHSFVFLFSHWGDFSNFSRPFFEFCVAMIILISGAPSKSLKIFKTKTKTRLSLFQGWWSEVLQHPASWRKSLSFHGFSA